ncbi:hypothetical protein MES5069_250083 [Mesorhizobium escarrei]|uniref:AB hydrolase-1 domain-containing protein n=2 Tax=Mesorhizobium escarrei TaxID=666018 RepID=A0ABM9DUD8_9HYPH|nr:hypothetical protein MES5069_250083 [Mesorhizobium escarrei]
MRDEVVACRGALIAKGIDLSAYNTAENAADINDVRKSLGIEKWVLYGVSYGTRLALEVMNEHPEGISASILDSVLPLDIDYPQRRWAKSGSFLETAGTRLPKGKKLHARTGRRRASDRKAAGQTAGAFAER